jgi:hypothetical protein
MENVKRGSKKDFEILRREAEKKQSGLALAMMAYVLSQWDIVPRNPTAAAELAVLAHPLLLAEAENSTSSSLLQYYLAVVEEISKTHSSEEILNQYRIAAAAGNWDAEYTVAQRLRTGSDTEANLEVRMSMLQSLAARGHMVCGLYLAAWKCYFFRLFCVNRRLSTPSLSSSNQTATLPRRPVSFSWLLNKG